LILYDKNGLFLGMGNQELYLLGYEDIEEFRNYHNDFADLFVNKPGFIFKFTNFSWIDYAQHSGTPNKRVLIRTKNGKEVESSLIITEIFLPKEINGSSVFFSVELTNSPFKYDIQSPQPSLESSEETLAPTLEINTTSLPQNETTLSEESSPIMFDSQEASSFESDYIPALIRTEEATHLPSEKDDTLSNMPPPLIQIDDDTFDFKLKFDHAILEDTHHDETPLPISVPSEYDSIDQIKPTDLQFVNTQLETYPEDNHEDLLSDQTLFVEGLREETPPRLKDDREPPFDLAECADKLGLDISTLAQIIEEYDETLTMTIPKLSDAIHENNNMTIIEDVQKLKSIALLLQIDSLYTAFDDLETNLNTGTNEKILQSLHELEHAIASFKETVL